MSYPRFQTLRRLGALLLLSLALAHAARAVNLDCPRSVGQQVHDVSTGSRPVRYPAGEPVAPGPCLGRLVP